MVPEIRIRPWEPAFAAAPPWECKLQSRWSTSSSKTRKQLWRRVSSCSWSCLLLVRYGGCLIAVELSSYIYQALLSFSPLASPTHQKEKNMWWRVLLGTITLVFSVLLLLLWLPKLHKMWCNSLTLFKSLINQKIMHGGVYSTSTLDTIQPSLCLLFSMWLSCVVVFPILEK